MSCWQGTPCTPHMIYEEDEFLKLTEMTEGLPFVDSVAGLLGGMWLFDDGRRHALVPERKWEVEL